MLRNKWQAITLSEYIREEIIPQGLQYIHEEERKLQDEEQKKEQHLGTLARENKDTLKQMEHETN